MFDKLEDLVRRFEEITNELTEPSVVNDQNRFRKLMKEQSDLQPLVDAYTEYRKCQETEKTVSPCWRASLMMRCVRCSRKRCLTRRSGS